ncbi:HV03 protein, partial [Alaudala cheleensis]|nr:HV03 protein [Alaudala cheleensis]
GLWAQPRLQEAGGGLRAPGDSVSLSCRLSSSAFEGYTIRWYRQAPGGSLEWVSLISFSDSVQKYGAAVEGQAEASRDSFQSQSSLFLWAPHLSTSTHYFCAFSQG